MSLKSKGCASERELVHILQAYGCAAIRVAGSGSTKTPSADIIVGKAGRTLVIEAKSSRNDHIYIPMEQMRDFQSFATQFGAEKWIAVRFTHEPWRFFLPEDIPVSAKNHCINRIFAQERGLTCEDVLNIQSSTQ